MAHKLLTGDAFTLLRTMREQTVHTCITSPPYFGLRDYGNVEQIGLEASPDAYVQKLMEVFREVRRVLRDDGTLWLNLGDSYANDSKWGGSSGGKHAKDLHGKTNIGRGKKLTGMKAKDLLGIPWRVAFALQSDGWYLRQDIIWHKPNPMPESVRDRCTKAHEYLFLLSKLPVYYFDSEAMQEPATGWNGSKFTDARDVVTKRRLGTGARKESETRNRRSVWTVPTKPFKEAHFATFPPDLIRPCVLAGSPAAGVVLDPFSGAATTGVVALEHGRHFVGIDLNSEYVAMAERRLAGTIPLSLRSSPVPQIKDRLSWTPTS